MQAAPRRLSQSLAHHRLAQRQCRKSTKGGMKNPHKKTRLSVEYGQKIPGTNNSKREVVNISQVAVTLYTVHDYCKSASDLVATIRKIRDIGYPRGPDQPGWTNSS